MLGLVAPAALAVLVGLLAGGSLSHWCTVRVRWWPVVAICMLVQVALFSPWLEQQPAVIACGSWLYVISLAGVLAVLLANARAGRGAFSPLALAALGVALNCLVILANGGHMPRSVEAAASVGQASASQPVRDRLVNVQPMTNDTQLVWLGDSLPQPRWLPMANVISVGDLLLAAGLACWAFRVTTPAFDWRAVPHRRRSNPDRSLGSTKEATVV